MTEPTLRDILDARELIEAIREGLGASDLGERITLEKWVMAQSGKPYIWGDDDPPAHAPTAT